MNKKLSKVLTLVVGALALIGFYFFARILMEGNDTVKDSPELHESIVSPYITYTMLLLIIATALAVIASLFTIVTRPRVLKKTLISLVVLGVLLFVAYSLASDAAVTNSIGEILEDGEKGPISKWVGTGLYYSFILGMIALVMYVFDFVRSLVK